jgi:preprotein translocase subunit SecA
MRKHLVDYDNVVNKHREVIYSERDKILHGADLKYNIFSILHDEIGSIVNKYIGNNTENPDYKNMLVELSDILPLPNSYNSNLFSRMNEKHVVSLISDYARDLYEKRENEMGFTTQRTERLIERKSEPQKLAINIGSKGLVTSQEIVIDIKNKPVHIVLDNSEDYSDEQLLLG